MSTGRLAFAALMVLSMLAPSISRADLLVDSFTDQNFIAENWGSGRWQGSPSGLAWDSGVLGKGFGMRTASDTAMYPSDKVASILVTNGNPGYRFGNDAINPSTATSDNRKEQTLTLSLARGSDYNASGDNYVRVTGWQVGATPPNSAFGINISQTAAFMAYPQVSVGPWDASGTNFVGINLSTSPKVFIIPIKNPTVFKVDPIYQAIFGKGSVSDWTQIRGLSFGWRRAGAPAAASNLSAQFVIDDVMFLANYPAYALSGTTAMELNEAAPGNTGTFSIALTALPSDNVTVGYSVPDPSKLEISSDGTNFAASASCTFTTTNWSTAKTFTVRSKGAFGGSAYNCTLNVTRTTNDLWYGDATNAPIGPVTVSVSPCTFSVTSAQSVAADPQDNLSVAVSNPTGGNCSWSASSADAWITNVSPASGSGSASVTFSVSSNYGAASRTGSITVAGQTHTIQQAGSPAIDKSAPDGTSWGVRQVGSGTQASKRLVVKNTGGTVLTLGACTTNGSAEIAAAFPAPGTQVAAGASIEIPVTYSPTSAAHQATELVILSDDPVYPQVSTTFTADGVDVTATPQTSFGYTKIAAAGGSGAVGIITLTNSGAVPLTYDVSVNDPTVEPDQTSLSVAAGDMTELILTYRPTAVATTSATITLTPVVDTLPVICAVADGRGYAATEGTHINVDGAAGGVVHVGTGGIYTTTRLEVPAGAFTGVREITVEEPDDTHGRPNAVEITINPPTTLAIPAKLVVGFNTADITLGGGSADFNCVGVARWNGSDYAFEAASFRPVDLGSGSYEASAPRSSFSLYATINAGHDVPVSLSGFHID